MAEKKGIQNVKEVMVLGLQLGIFGKMTMEDGEVSVADLGLAVQVFPYVIPAFSDIGEVPKELADLDGNESEELLLEAARQLPMITDKRKLTDIIIKSVKLALSIGELTAVIMSKDVEA